MSHAELAPSGSKRWLNCPGSVIRLREFPVQDKSNPAAILGTHIHTLSELKLRGEIEELLDEIGETYTDHEGDFEVTLEMVEAAEYYCAYVYEVLGEDATMWVEKKVTLFYHIDDTGTADVVAIVGDTLHIIDLKTGFFKVFAHGNTQLRIYAGSAYEELIEYYDIEHVHCHIVMTKHKETSDECIPVEELTAFMSYVTDVVEVIDNDPTNAKCIAGHGQCQWCPLKLTCEENQQFQLSMMQDEFSDFDLATDDIKDLKPEHLRDVSDIEAEALSGLCDAYDMAIKFWKDVKARAEALALDGTSIPRYKLVRGKSNRKWRDEDAEAEVDKLLRRNGIKKTDLWNEKFLSPKQTLDLMKQRKKSAKTFDKVNALIIKPTGKLTLVPMSDKREAVLNSVEEEMADFDDDVL